MPLKHAGYIELPPNAGAGGFDHAAVHRGRDRLYVAHTANDSVDVVDVKAGRFLRSIDGLPGVAGALVDETLDLVFTSNRGEDTVSIVRSDDEAGRVKVGVGVRPNGLAFDAGSRTLLAANVGDPERTGTHTVTLVDVEGRSVRASIEVPGRTRWTVFDAARDRFFVNIAEPAIIAVIDPGSPGSLVGSIPIPDRGPHGLDLDPSRQRLYCACDGGKLVGVETTTGSVTDTLELSGAPDVIFLDAALQHLYVAIGDPGVIDVIDTARWRRIETVGTERGAHTLALDDRTHTIYAFLPGTHRAAVLVDEA